jgi:hypothetical protein
MSASVRYELVPVRNPVERFFFTWFFVLIPGVYIVRLPLEYAGYGTLPYALHDLAKIAVELSLLIFLTLANTFLATVRPTIASLFSNGVVSRQTGGDGELLETQATCEQTIDRLLNHGARILVAGIVASATLYYYVARRGDQGVFVSTTSLLNFLDDMLYFVPTVCSTYFVGIVVWKLFVISVFFQYFPERYALVPRFLHPDGACGLLPLGDLCLRMMYVAVIPTVLSALFLLSYFVAPQGIARYVTLNALLISGVTPLILGVGIIGLVIGFLPLFRFHLAIIKYRHEWTEQLKALSERIIAEKAKILRPPEDLKEEHLDFDKVLKTLTELQSYYESSRKVRMWPVDRGLSARIWGSVALLSGQLVALIEIVRKLS